MTEGRKSGLVSKRKPRPILSLKSGSASENHAVERLWMEMNCRTNCLVKGALVQLENKGIIDIEDEATKYCVSMVTRQVVEVGMEYVVSSGTRTQFQEPGFPFCHPFLLNDISINLL